MKNNYSDILNRIKEEPKWFDPTGCPRYETFHPKYLDYTGGKPIFLLKICCQRCSKVFKVAVVEIKDREPTYGDPPRTNCCMAGDTMNSTTISILEYWKETSDECFGVYKKREKERDKQNCRFGLKPIKK